MWFKKKAYISGYNSNTAVDGTDWRTNGNSNYWSVSQTLPSAADAGKYFYLPALGYYRGGYLNYNRHGYYWSSSAYVIWGSSGYAYYLDFSWVNIRVDSHPRDYGYRVGGFK